MTNLHIVFMVLSLAACACSHPSADPDAGGHDASDPSDPSDLSDDFAISIPPGSQVCTMCGGRDARLEYRLKGRITFRPGLVRLPPRENFVDADLIESVELGPDRLPAAPRGPGNFKRKQEGEEYHYEYVQPFVAGGEPFEVRLTAIFGDQVLTLDDDTLTMDAWNPWNRETPPRFLMEATWGDGSELHNQIQRYAGCRHDPFTPGTGTVEIDGGADTLVLKSRCPPPVPIAGGGVCPCPLVQAAFTSGDQQRVIDDHFRLLYTSGGMHCWHTAFLVVLDQPVGPTHAVLIESDIYPAEEAHYLDADLQTIESRPITASDWVWE
jgi:hypothetical protein